MRGCFGTNTTPNTPNTFSPFSFPDERRGAENAGVATVAASVPGIASVPGGTDFQPVEDKADAPKREPADPLTCAAECMERGDEAGAVPHLRSHLRKYPDAIMIRTHLAELLFRLDKLDEARALFDQVIIETQGKSAAKQLVHCHTRLIEIAEREDDQFAKLLNRGIGLYLLVERWDREETRNAALDEQTLAKASAALREARELQPDNPRVNLYFGEVAARMGLTSVARSAFRQAQAALPDPSVSPHERERIERQCVREEH